MHQHCRRRRTHRAAASAGVGRKGLTVDIMDTDADVLKTVKAGAMPSIEHRARDSSSRLTIGNSRVRSAVVYVAVAVGLVVATAILRGQAISDWGLINPDEAGLIAEARAARLSPVPWSTWVIGTRARIGHSSLPG